MPQKDVMDDLFGSPNSLEQILLPGADVSYLRELEMSGTTERGTPQGAGISPLLANIFLHYALDLWVINGAVGMHAVGYRSFATPTTSSWVSRAGRMPGG